MRSNGKGSGHYKQQRTRHRDVNSVGMIQEGRMGRAKGHMISGHKSQLRRQEGRDKKIGRRRKR